MKKIVLLAFVSVLLSTVVAVRFVRPVEASGTIYIRADGSVEGTDKIQRDGNIYTFTDNIYDEIVVERDNIVVDGAGYMVQGSGSGNGFYWSSKNNVTIKNINIKDFWIGIYLQSTSSNMISGNNIKNNYIGIYLRDSSNNSIYGNNITNNEDSIWLDWSSNNSVFENSIRNNGHGIFLYDSNHNNISGNSIRNNNYYGIWLKYSSNNSISGSNIKNNNRGIRLYESSNNSVSGNSVTANNYYGIWLDYSSNNIIYHNNFVDNAEQVYSYDSTNVWDDGYPSGGNYWSDYNGTDLYSGSYQSKTGKDGIGDTPYIIGENNQDNYPLMIPHLSLEEMRVLYYELLTSYNALNSMYNSLNATYNELESKQEATINELNNIRNLMYVFIATTVILIATTIYFAKRKPKIKAETPNESVFKTDVSSKILLVLL